MSYKDPDKQREADKARQQRRRDVIKAKGVTKQGVTVSSSGTHVTPSVFADPKDLSPDIQGAIALSKVGVLCSIVGQPKRGKDIKTFADLPPDVQETIDMMSTTDGKLDKDEKVRRTAAAIKYQHLFPESYEPGHMEITRAEAIVTGKPGDADYNGVCTSEWRAERGR